MKSTASTAVLALVVGTSAANASIQTLFIDFGNVNQLTAGDYNNVTETTVSLLNLVDSTGAPSGITLTIDDPFFNNGPPSQLGTESPSGDAAIFPVSATDDYLFGHTGAFAGGDSNPTGGFVLSGLNDAFTYNFTFLGSRTGVSDNRETRYSVAGLNNDTGLLAVSNNDSQVLDLLTISPNAGEISVSVEAGPNNDNGNSFYYLNALRIEVVPTPTTAAPLLAGAVLLTRRRRG